MIDQLLHFRLSKSLQKYLYVGAGAFAMEYGSFYLMYEVLHIPLIIANSGSFGLGLLTSFLLNRFWTFSTKEYSKKAAHQFGFYVTLALINLVLTNLIVEWLGHMGFNPKYGKLVAMIVTSLWNYMLFKVIIFSHKKTVPSDQPD